MRNEEDGMYRYSMDFGAALASLRQGLRVARDGWNGRGMWIALQFPDDTSKMTLPYVYMRTVTGDFVPWLASQADILATDWVIVPSETSAAMQGRELVDLTPDGPSPFVTLTVTVAGVKCDVVVHPDWGVPMIVRAVLVKRGYEWPAWELRDREGAMVSPDAAAGDLQFGEFTLNQPTGVGG
jgi:hypothetical protein